MSVVLVDTCILVDYLRGRDDAIEFIDDMEDPPVLSAVTVAELFAGVRERTERIRLDGMVGACRIVPVDAAIAESGGLIWRQYGRSHGLDLVDAIIAATAVPLRLTLVTLNRKHFPTVSQLVVPYG